MTERFRKFILELSLDPDDNPNCLQNISNNRYLPGKSMVLPGSEIFNLFLEGCKVMNTDERNNVIEQSLNDLWPELDRHFEDALTDITETTNDKVKSSLENWYEVLKKFMAMW